MSTFKFHLLSTYNNVRGNDYLLCIKGGDCVLGGRYVRSFTPFVLLMSAVGASVSTGRMLHVSEERRIRMLTTRQKYFTSCILNESEMNLYNRIQVVWLAQCTAKVLSHFFISLS